MSATEITAHDRLHRFKRNSQTLAAAQPEVVETFWQLHKQVTTPGALDRKTKELLALAISIAMRCDDCIAHHVSDALEAGATRDEMCEALSVATLMGGGVSLVYATHAIETLDQLSPRKK